MNYQYNPIVVGGTEQEGTLRKKVDCAGQEASSPCPTACIMVDTVFPSSLFLSVCYHLDSVVSSFRVSQVVGTQFIHCITHITGSAIIVKRYGVESTQGLLVYVFQCHGTTDPNQRYPAHDRYAFSRFSTQFVPQCIEGPVQLIYALLFQTQIGVDCQLAQKVGACFLKSSLRSPTQMVYIRLRACARASCRP